MFTPLHLASIEGHLKIVELLLLKGAKIDARESRGKTALHLAARGGHLALVQFLIKAGASKDSKDSQGNQGPML
jgi:ankyrin repeat protein